MAHSSIHKSLGKGWSLRMYKSLWQNVVLPQPVLLGVKIVKSRCWSQRNHGVLLKIVLVRTYIFPVPKKKTISMLQRWEDSTNICTLIIWGIGMEKTLKQLVHLKEIIKDHRLAEDEWREDGVRQMLKSRLLITHTRNGLKWLPNIAVRCYQYFTWVLPYVREDEFLSYLI